jgi:hypothetical protein
VKKLFVDCVDEDHARRQQDAEKDTDERRNQDVRIEW